MPFCPKCKYEYREGITVCPDCDLKLIPKLHEEEKQPELEYVDLVEVGGYMFDSSAGGLKSSWNHTESRLRSKTP